jgi:hypothetical protein
LNEEVSLLLPPDKKGSKMNEGSEVEKKLEKRFGLMKVLSLLLPPQ